MGEIRQKYDEDFKKAAVIYHMQIQRLRENSRRFRIHENLPYNCRRK